MLSDEVERVFRGVRCPKCHSFSIQVEEYCLRIKDVPNSFVGYMVRIKCGQCGEKSPYYYGRDISEGIRRCVKEWRKENE